MMTTNDKIIALFALREEDSIRCAILLLRFVKPDDFVVICNAILDLLKWDLDINKESMQHHYYYSSANVKIRINCVDSIFIMHKDEEGKWIGIINEYNKISLMTSGSTKQNISSENVIKYSFEKIYNVLYGNK